MSSDPLKCSVLALIDQAQLTAAQLRVTAEDPEREACFPRSFRPLADRARELLALRAACDERYAKAAYARKTVELAYLPAERALAEVRVWASELRILIAAADGNAEGHRLASQVRTALRGDLRRVAGTIAMLDRALPVLERLADDLAPWLDAREQIEAVPPYREALVSCQDHRAESGTASVGVTRTKQAVDADLRAMMRQIRRVWKLVLLRHGERIAPLNLMYAASDVANQPAKRAARARAAVEPGDAAPERVPQGGFASADGGLNCAESGSVDAERGVASASHR